MSGHSTENRRKVLDRLDREEAVHWQPIETAPKDGTKILLGRFDGTGREYDGRIRVDWWRSRMGAGYTGFGHFNPTYWPPTHWMPLPAPPDGEVGE